ncbi:MAG: 50S ribosomal protein L29 [Candidatus Woesearchaeota archaeon]|jgi:ribosomal protein L29
MAKLKVKELGKLSDDELAKKLVSLKEELIKVSVITNQEKNTAMLAKNIKRNIARILTVKRLREIYTK